MEPGGKGRTERIREIRNLLCDMYGGAELWRTAVAFDAEIGESLPERGSQAEIAHELVLALLRRGTGDAFLEVVAAERPGRRADIERVREESRLRSEKSDGLPRLMGLDALVPRFNQLRSSLEPGPERSAALDVLFVGMVDCRHLSCGLVADAWAADLGTRSAWYARAHGSPETVAFNELIAAASVHEAEGYGQYWALRAAEVATREGPRRRLPTRLLAAFDALGATLSVNGRRRTVFEAVRGRVVA